MKKELRYLPILVLIMIGIYFYNQYKFEKFFMNAKLYGSSKVVPDSTFAKIKEMAHDNSKDYSYSLFLRTDEDDTLGEIHFRTIFDKNLKIIGGGSGGSLLGHSSFYGIKNSIYLKHIPEKSVFNGKTAYYLIVEYEKEKQIQYYFEITDKMEKNIYTVYFKSYPPKMILNAKNEYIKD